MTNDAPSNLASELPSQNPLERFFILARDSDFFTLQEAEKGTLAAGTHAPPHNTIATMFSKLLLAATAAVAVAAPAPGADTDTPTGCKRMASLHNP